MNVTSGPRPSASKKTKTSALYQTKVSVAWTKIWPFIREVKSYLYKFLCTTCNREVSCAHISKATAYTVSNAKSLKSQLALPLQSI